MKEDNKEGSKFRNDTPTNKSVPTPFNISNVTTYHSYDRMLEPKIVPAPQQADDSKDFYKISMVCMGIMGGIFVIAGTAFTIYKKYFSNKKVSHFDDSSRTDNGLGSPHPSLPSSPPSYVLAIGLTESTTTDSCFRIGYGESEERERSSSQSQVEGLNDQRNSREQTEENSVRSIQINNRSCSKLSGNVRESH